MIISPKRKAHRPIHRRFLIPTLLIVPVVLTGLYVSGVPWAVTALDRFWEGVDRLGRHSGLMWAVTGLSWAGAALTVYRLHRLSQWNQRVLAALKAATSAPGPSRERGREALAELSRTSGIPYQDREWVRVLLTIVSPRSPQDGCDHNDQQ
jgi:hypothetical protein